MADSLGWSLTESDPGVFTGLLQELGVEGLEVAELWGLDSALLQELYPVHALIFLFKWIGHGDPATADGKQETPEVQHYFAHQVINNACASIAILNAALNIEDPDVKLGEELENLKAFSDGLDPETKGWTISNSERIRAVHNSFARNDPYSLEEARPQADDEDAYHFIAYVPIGDKLYELDGLKHSPVSHGAISGGREKWTDLAQQVLERRIATHPPGEVHFNLMAITSRSAFLKRKVETLTAVAASGDDALVVEQLEDAKDRLAKVQEQFKEWDFDNALRRHNFIGLIHGLLHEMAKQKKLEPQIEAAKEEMKRKLADQKAKGKTQAEAMEDVVDG
ncbi:hypothetical protein T439DRAFT_300694 [Meredithblackwellia eburnea MCA 4105]